MNSEIITIRMATSRDAAQLQAIYAPYVQNTPISLEYTAPDTAEFAQRIVATLKTYPYLVAEVDGNILGYSYAGPFHARAGYKWTVESSIYVREDITRGGIGRMLYQKLEEILVRQNIVNVVACIIYPNARSIGFHTAMGFEKVALFPHIAYKLGEWHDVIWMKKTISQKIGTPLPVLPISEIDPCFEV